MIEVFSERPNGQTSPAIRVVQNANDISDPSAIRTALRQERAGKRRGFVPAANTRDRTGETRQPMIGYM
jgi:hypothetical protein